MLAARLRAHGFVAQRAREAGIEFFCRRLWPETSISRNGADAELAASVFFAVTM
jgi:hypothetical protein